MSIYRPGNGQYAVYGACGYAGCLYLRTSKTIDQNALSFFSGGKIQKSAEDKIPIVIYSDDKRYWNVFGPICRELDRRGEEAVFMTSSPDDPGLSETFTHVRSVFIGEGNKGYAKLNMLRASVLLATTPGLDVYQWRRSKDVDFYVHNLHMASDATLYRLYGLDYYDAVLLSGAIRQTRSVSWRQTGSFRLRTSRSWVSPIWMPSSAECRLLKNGNQRYSQFCWHPPGDPAAS